MKERAAIVRAAAGRGVRRRAADHGGRSRREQLARRALARGSVVACALLALEDEGALGGGHLCLSLGLDTQRMALEVIGAEHRRTLLALLILRILVHLAQLLVHRAPLALARRVTLALARAPGGARGVVRGKLAQHTLSQRLPNCDQDLTHWFGRTWED